jgi:hypothetical protein
MTAASMMCVAIIVGDKIQMGRVERLVFRFRYHSTGDAFGSQGLIWFRKANAAERSGFFPSNRIAALRRT